MAVLDQHRVWRYLHHPLIFHGRHQEAYVKSSACCKEKEQEAAAGYLMCTEI